MADPPRHIHLPTPGDHYSPSTGSAIMTVVYELSRQHVRRGGEASVIVATGTRHDYPVGRCLEAGLPPYQPRTERSVDAALGMSGLPRWLAERRYAPALEVLEPAFDGVLFVHNAPAPLRLLRRRLRHAHLVLHCHNELFRSFTAREMERVLGRADTVVCVSEHLARTLRARVPSRGDRIVGITNGVDVERFRPRAEARAAGGPPVLLYVGRVVPDKGVHLLLDALEDLVARDHEVLLRVVGSHGFSAEAPLSGYERELRRRATRARLPVEFVPFTDRHRITDVYQGADIFCAPSVWTEPCSLTVPEAMASGLPTVCADSGGLTEVGGDAALYFDADRPSGLVTILERLLVDDDHREKRGLRARRQAESRSWGRQYALLAEILERRSRGATVDEASR